METSSNNSTNIYYWAIGLVVWLLPPIDLSIYECMDSITLLQIRLRN